MKILLVNDYGTATGGAELIIATLRNELRRRGHEVRFFSSRAGVPPGMLVADHECFGTIGRFRTLLQSANLHALAALRRVIGSFRPDVVHVNLYLTQLSPWILQALREVPSLYYAQWARAICPRGTRFKPDRTSCSSKPGLSCLTSGCVPLHDWLPLMGQMRVDHSQGSRFARVVAISQWIADQLAQYGPAHLHHANVVHPGTAYAPPRATLPARPHLVFAGRLVPEKGVETLLHAVKQLGREGRELTLSVAGQGPSRPALQRLSAELGLTDRVAFLGFQPHAAIQALMRTATLLCVPSLWHEPFGLVAAEAQMHGVAVVASRSGGLSEVVDDGQTGRLVTPGDPDALAEAIGTLVADRAHCDSLGRAGHERAVSHFGVSQFADRFEAVYRSLVQGAPAHA